MKRTYKRARPIYPQMPESLPAHARERLMAAWGPLIDLTDRPSAVNRLRALSFVPGWVFGETSPPPLVFTRIGMPGLRRQVVRHLRMPDHEARRPEDLPHALRTPAWEALVEAVDRFGDLDWGRRSHVLVWLAQLSFHQLAIALAESVSGADAGEGGAAAFRYHGARVLVGTPGGRHPALAVFTDLATDGNRNGTDPLLQAAACFQGIGHALRAGDLEQAAQFESVSERLVIEESWPSALVASRLNRARALLSVRSGDLVAAWNLLRDAEWFAGRLAFHPPDLDKDVAALVDAENRRFLLELRLELLLVEGQARRDDIVTACSELVELDPACVYALSTVGDAYMSLGELEDAVEWYEAAGELRTNVGAVALFRAAQCREQLGDLDSARDLFAAVLELDSEAIEPRDWLRNHMGRS